MQYTQLGRTGLQVSKICLGTMTFGEQNTEAQAHQQLDYALGEGVNFIDTAEMYAIPPKAETQGLTEAYIGSWLGKRADRDKIIVATKVTGPGSCPYLRGGPELSSKQIEKALHESLRRLQTDYIDLYQVHWPSRRANYFGRLGYQHQEEETIAIEETLAALAKWVEQGKIRHVGISNETPWGVMQYLKLAEQNGWPRIVSIQNPYNLLNRTFEIGLAEIAHREQVGLLSYSPLGFGVLSGKYLNDKRPDGARITLYEKYTRYTNELGIKATAQYADLAQQVGLTPTQLALAYINSRPFLTANIIGATTMSQLEENIATINIDLDESVLEKVEAIHQQIPNPCP